MTGLETIKANMTKKLGPLPAWAWGVIVGSGILVWRQISSGGSAPASDGVAGTTVGFGSTVIPSFSGGGAPPPTSDAPLVDPGFGFPSGDTPNLYVGTPEGFTAEGSPDTVAGVFEEWLAAQRAKIEAGGNAGVAPAPEPIAAPTPLPTPTPAPAPSQPVPTTTYTIQAGDTLSKIARRYGTTWQAIWELNKPMRSGNPNLIYPGEVIRIPS